jgi:pre-mRNA-splicing factor ATP-dependent RNA helicase DHX16
MTSREYARQVMEIKPEWLLEGASLLLHSFLLLLDTDAFRHAVAPHFFKPADLDSLGGTKKGQVNVNAKGAAQLPKEGQA